MAQYFGHSFGLTEEEEKKLQQIISHGKKVIDVIRRGIEEFLKDINKEKKV